MVTGTEGKSGQGAAFAVDINIPEVTTKTIMMMCKSLWFILVAFSDETEVPRLLMLCFIFR
jgi:hypothetical protein